MNIVYVVTPLALLVAFAGYFVPASARLDAALATRAVTEAQRRADEKREQEEQRAIAVADQKERAATRIRELAEKERVKREAQNRRDAALFDSLAQSREARDTLRSEISELEARLQHLVSERDRVDGTLHSARAALAERLIARRNADLELQRMTLLLAELVDANIVASPPLFPSPRSR